MAASRAEGDDSTHPWADCSFVDGVVLFNRLEAPIGARPTGRSSDRRRGHTAASTIAERRSCDDIYRSNYHVMKGYNIERLAEHWLC